MEKRILMVAGESSGDLHGAHLASALRRMDPTLTLVGVGGVRMKSAGVQLLYGIEEMGVVGVFEVFSHFKTIARVYWMLKRFLADQKADLVILIDYPDFNLRIARVAKRLGIPVLYYISPQVWAWRRGRIQLIKRLVERMMVILPFEKKIYEDAGVPCSFVGHPLLDEISDGFDREGFFRRHELDPGKPVLGILPGSRRSEVTAHMPVLLKALPLIREKVPDLQVLLAVASSLSPDWIRSYCTGEGLKMHCVSGETSEVLKASDAVITASGTATLQAAVCGTPMVIIYRVSPWTYLLGRLLVRVDHIGLVNVVAEKEVVPELIQGEVVPPNIVEAVTPLLLDSEFRDHIKKDLNTVREKLGTPGASQRAAEVVMAYLNREKIDSSKNESLPFVRGGKVG